jgi:hypothetical protein
VGPALGLFDHEVVAATDPIERLLDQTDDQVTAGGFGLPAPADRAALDVPPNPIRVARIRTSIDHAIASPKPYGQNLSHFLGFATPDHSRELRPRSNGR